MESIPGFEKRDVTHAGKRSKWEHHIESWERSGQSQAAYCREHGLSYGLFAYWKRRLKRPESYQSAVKLVPIGVSRAFLPPANTATPLRLFIDERYQVEVLPGFDGATLKRLIEALG